MLDAPSQTDNDLLKQAAEFIWGEGKCSTSFIQRSLGIGYNKAARIIERLEELSVVSRPDHVGRRTVRSRDDLSAALEFKATISAIVGDNNTKPMIAAIVTSMKAQDAETKRKRGNPPLKPDASFDAAAASAYSVTADELRQFIERAEQLAAEKKDVAEQEKELFAEAKGRGYDTKVMRKVIALRKRKPDDVAEEEAILDMYKSALGMA
jgi:uncharacterized protein (UPF0335 family)